MFQKIKLPLLAVLSGLLTALSFPPYNFTLFAFVGLIPLLYIEHKISAASAAKLKVFGLSYLAFFTWNLLCCYWIYFAKDFSTGNFVFIGVAFEVLVNSLLYALMFLLFHVGKKKLNKTLWPFLFIALWLSLEYIHFQDWELSWPWLVLGNAFSNMPYLVQWYSVTGVLGGSLWLLSINWMLLHAVIVWREQKKFNQDAFRILIRTDLWILAPMVVSVALYLSYEENIKPVSVVVVQPNIDPYNEKFTSMTSAQQMHKILNLAKTKITDTTQYLLLPETAIPNGEWEELLSESANIDSLSTLFNTHPKTKIISGLSSYAEVFPKNQNDLPVSFRKDDQGWYESYNAAVQIDTTFNFQIYHKSLLVIGAEKMPFANLLKPLSSLIIDFGGTTGSLGVQSERSLLYAPDSSMAIAPIICYESIYSDYVADYVQKGAQLLFIMTNDGWWDNSPGYQQHFAFARLRAIENRRSIARSANTGISGFINQRGDIVDASEFWTDAALSTTLNANTELSVFSRFPRFLGTLAWITASVLLLTTLILFFKGKAV